MKLFSVFIAENQLDVGNEAEHNGVQMWNSVKDKANKIKTKLTDYELFHYKGLYVLVNNGQYIAHLEDFNDSIQDNTIYINDAYSGERGMYRVLLLEILNIRKVERIVSDNVLSTYATSFWKKIINDPSLTKILVNYKDQTIFEGKSFTGNEWEMFKDKDYRIGISKS